MDEELFSEERLQALTATRDELMSELIYVDHLMRSIGFTDGLATVKHTAAQMCKKEFTAPQDPGFNEEGDLL